MVQSQGREDPPSLPAIPDGHATEPPQWQFREKGDDGDGDARSSSGSVAEEILEESWGEEVEDATAAAELGVSLPAAALSLPVSGDDGATGERVDGLGARVTADSQAAHEGEGVGDTGEAAVVEVGREEISPSQLQNCDHVEAALLPTGDEGVRGDYFSRRRQGDGSRLEGLGYKTVEDAIAVGTVEEGLRPAEDSADGGEAAADTAESAPVEGEAVASAGAPVQAKEGVAAAPPAAVSDDDVLRSPLDGTASVQASDKTESGDGAYSESFEEDQDEDESAGLVGDAGREDGARYNGAAEPVSAPDAADAAKGTPPGAKVHNEQVLSSVSEVNSDELLAKEQASFVGSFSVGRDYLEAALPPPAVNPPSAGDGAGSGADDPLAGSGGGGGDGDAKSWQALVFDASPPAERERETDGDLRAPTGTDAAAAADTDESGPSAGCAHEAGGSPGAAFAAAASEEALEGREDDGDGVVPAHEEPPENVSNGVLSKLASEAVDEVDAWGEESREERNSRAEVSGKIDGGGRDDDGSGNGDGAAEGLLLPSSGESLGGDSTGSFHHDEGLARVAGAGPKGWHPSASLAEVASAADGSGAAALENGYPENVGGGDGGGGGGSVDGKECPPSQAVPDDAAPAEAGDAEDPVGGVENSHSRVDIPTAPADGAENVVRLGDPDPGLTVEDKKVRLLDGMYNFVEDAEPAEGVRPHDRDGDDGDGDDDDELAREAETWGAHVRRPDQSPPRSAPSPAAVAEPPSSFGGDGSGADANTAGGPHSAVESQPELGIGGGNEGGAGKHREEPRGEDEDGDEDGVELSPGAERVVAEGADGGDGKPGAWAGDYDFEEDAVSPTATKSKVNVAVLREAQGALVAENGQDLSPGVQEVADRRDGDGEGGWSDEYDFEEQAVAPASPEGGPRVENERLSAGPHARETRGGDAEPGALSGGYDFEEDADVVAVAGPSAEEKSSRQEDESALPVSAVEASTALTERGDKGDDAETRGYRDWAAGDSVDPPSDVAGDGEVDAVTEKAEADQDDEPPLAESPRLESSSPPLEGMGVPTLGGFDHVEDVVRFPARRGADEDVVGGVDPRLEVEGADAEQQRSSAAVGRSYKDLNVSVDVATEGAAKEGGGKGVRQDSLPVEVGEAGGDLAVATTAVLDSGHDSVERVENDVDVDVEGPGDNVTVDGLSGGDAVAASAAFEPADAAVAAPVAAAPDVGEVSGRDPEAPTPAVEPETATVPISINVNASDDDISTARPEAAPAMPEISTSAANPPEDEGGDKEGKDSNKERLVDDITDHLLANLLKRALATPPSPTATTSDSDSPAAAVRAPAEASTNSGGALQAQLDGEAYRQGLGVGAGVGADSGDGDGKEGRRRSPTKWEQLTSDEDAEDDEDDEDEDDVMGGGAADWGNAAVTETYRSEEGMVMVVRDNSSDDGGGSDAYPGGSPQQLLLLQRLEEEEEEEGLLGLPAPPQERQDRGGGGRGGGFGVVGDDEEVGDSCMFASLRGVGSSRQEHVGAGSVSSSRNSPPCLPFLWSTR